MRDSLKVCQVKVTPIAEVVIFFNALLRNPEFTALRVSCTIITYLIAAVQSS